MARHRIALVLGTRPEAVKLAPVVRVLRTEPHEFEPLVITTGQHRQMLDQILGVFDIAPDVDLDVMRPNQPLAGLTCRVLEGLTELLRSAPPDAVVVQGDTTTAFAAGLAGFYLRIPVVHVEAGLRSYDLDNPFPEEANRRLVGVLSAVHFAPTAAARSALIAEGVSPARIAVTGNPVVDALSALPSKNGDATPGPLSGIPWDTGRVVLVTAHRRESWGAALIEICAAVAELVDRHDDVHVVYPVHLNPNVDHTVRSILSDRKRVHLVPPLDYLAFVEVMRRAHLILTDSGGVQEEAPSFGKPILVLRNVTERPEGVARGVAKLVGTDRGRIVGEANRLLTDPAAYESMRIGGNPYGDGRAGERIVEALGRWLREEQPLLPPGHEFGEPEAAPVATRHLELVA